MSLAKGFDLLMRVCACLGSCMENGREDWLWYHHVACIQNYGRHLLAPVGVLLWVDYKVGWLFFVLLWVLLLA